jgi:hypothetical protein
MVQAKSAASGLMPPNRMVEHHAAEHANARRSLLSEIGSRDGRLGVVLENDPRHSFGNTMLGGDIVIPRPVMGIGRRRMDMDIHRSDHVDHRPLWHRMLPLIAPTAQPSALPGHSLASECARTPISFPASSHRDSVWKQPSYPSIVWLPPRSPFWWFRLMELRQLAYLAGIVRAGSFSGAASALNVAQPALSRQIALLERELGVLLLTRNSRGIVPTPAGEEFFARAIEILRNVEDSKRELKALFSIGASAVIKIGLPLTVSRLLTPELFDKSRALPRDPNPNQRGLDESHPP